MLNNEVKKKLIEFCRIVARVDGMQFVIHANENCGHNKGHVHIESGDDEIEIDLQTFKILNASGKITPHKKSKQ